MQLAFLTHSGDSGGVLYPVTDSGQGNGPHEKSGGFAPPLFLCLFAVVCPAGKDLHAAIFDHINQAVCLVNPAGPQPGQIAL